MKNAIIVNATALKSSGALTILKQFLYAIPRDEFDYLIFVGSNIKIEGFQKNIKIVQKDVKSLIRRFYWDSIGVYIWLKKNKINPISSVSLQNTNFWCGKSIPNYIYYHQPIPFFNKNWNILKSNERQLWFYKNLYPIFISLYINRATEIFVQLNFIQEKFAERFSFPKEKIHIITPRIDIPKKNKSTQLNLDKSRLNLFYPATPLIYKNHDVILQALILLSKNSNISLFLTCEEKDLNQSLLKKLTYIDIKYLGKISFSEVLEMYKASDALLFPSYIETFGLPLIEAASFGIPIIVSDLPYSREVLRDYSGVKYVTFNDSKEWKDQILSLLLRKGEMYTPLKLRENNSWSNLFQIIKNKL